MKLHSLKAGFKGKIESLEGASWLLERLLEIGLVPGTDIQIKSRMFFGEPVIVEARNTSFALRNEEAACITLRGG